MVIIFAVPFPYLSSNHLIHRWSSGNEGLSYCSHSQLVSNESADIPTRLLLGTFPRVGRIKDCSIAHSQGTADSAVRDLLVLPVGFQWMNLEEVVYLRWKTSLLLKSVRRWVLVWLSCFSWENSCINNYFLNEQQPGKLVFQKKRWCGLFCVTNSFFWGFLQLEDWLLWNCH